MVGMLLFFDRQRKKYISNCQKKSAQSMWAYTMVPLGRKQDEG